MKAIKQLIIGFIFGIATYKVLEYFGLFQMKIKTEKNEKEKIIACLREDFEKTKVKDLEREQARNVYVNTFYFAALSIAFGIAYLFFIG